MKKIKIYGRVADEATQKQIEAIGESKALEGQNIAIMPDNHLGKGACIGFTSTFDDKIIPNLVGVDIGCGMSMIKMPDEFVKEYNADKMGTLKKLQSAIRKNVPHGFNVHKDINHGGNYIENMMKSRLMDLTFKINFNKMEHIIKSVGTLGGGNHFIELNESKKGNLYLVIHSGSRGLGVLVANHHQEIAKKNFIGRNLTQEEVNAIAPQDRQEFIKNYDYDKNKKVKDSPEEGLEYLVGEQVDDYLNDMKMTQGYARKNREQMILNIFEGLSDEFEKDFYSLGISIDFPDRIKHTIHNYVDVENKIIRKGAIFANPDNDIIIPLNMRDGSIIARGKPNKDANYSAPHGAGRIMSRMKAKKEIKLDDFKDAMKDVVSGTVNENTLDEAPFAYKPKEEIIEGLKELVEIKEIIKPVFNFKDDSSNNKRKKRR